MISIVIPLYNEEKNVELLVREIKEAMHNFEYELLLVDDGSQDNTLSEATRIALDFKQCNVLSHTKNSGIMNAWHTGISEAKYDLACLFDGDLQISATEIPRLIQAMKKNNLNRVQGVRSSEKELHISRQILSKSLNYTINLLFRTHDKDSKSGFVIAPTWEILDFTTRFKRYRYGQTFIGVWLRKMFGEMGEVQVRFGRRMNGKSFISNYKILATITVVFFEIINVRSSLKNEIIAFNEIAYESDKPRELKYSLRKKFYFATLPAHTWNLSRKTRSYYQVLTDLQFEKADFFEDLQYQRLKKLLSSAVENVPYYQDVFASIDIKTFSKSNFLEKLRQLPALEKETVRNSQGSLISSKYRIRDLHPISTSGSTGSPLRIFVDSFQLSMRFASTLRAYEMLGWSFGEPQLRLWHQTLGMSRMQVLREKIDAVLQKRIFVGAFQIDQLAITKLQNLIELKKPVIIDGYAESLNMISLHSQRKSAWMPRTILSSAQELPKVTQVNIESMFGCKVLNKYGAREFSGIAYECPSQEGMHILMESYIVEILRNGEPVLPGEVGEVFITDLNNFSMPLIRYRIGDLAELSASQETCSCGRSTPRISRIVGRTQALVEGGNGVLMPGTFFSHFFKEYFDYVKSYQVHQALDRTITVKCIPTSRMQESISQEIIQKLKIYLGSASSVKYEQVDEIPLGRTGKRQSVISELHRDFQELQADFLIEG